MKVTPIEQLDAFVIYDAPMPPNRGVLDPVTVILHDHGGRGGIIVECYGCAWSCYFGSIGSETLREFIAGCDKYYLASKLVTQTVRHATKREELYAQNIAEAVINALKGGAT